jgi:hypothetical protein
MMITTIHIPEPVVVVLISTGVAAVVSLLTLWVSGQREARQRRRRSYAEALAVGVAYREFPYAIRRRRDDVAGEERVRLSEALREIQRDLAFHEAWTKLEGSRGTIQAFDRLVAETRKIAGTYMHGAWNGSPAKTDADMNITDIDYSSIKPLETGYLAEVRKDLSWWRFWR